MVCCVNHVSLSSLWFAHQKNVQSDAFHLRVWERAEELQIEWICPFETWDPPTRPPPNPHPDNVINYATYFSSTYFIKLWWSKICSKSLYRLHYSFPRRDERLQRFTSFAYLCLKLPTTDPHTETSLRRSNAIKKSLTAFVKRTDLFWRFSSTPFPFPKKIIFGQIWLKAERDPWKEFLCCIEYWPTVSPQTYVTLELNKKHVSHSLL